jgi:ABC-type transporter Mla MlaB component
MLRITLHNDETKCRLELAGKLAGPWVAETEHVWRSVWCSDKEIEVDMREVTGVDDAGRELLASMHRAGACFTAEGVAMITLIEEISGEQPLNASERQQRKKVLPKNEDSRTRRHTK